MTHSASIATTPLPGFNGIWYSNQTLGPPHHYKYSGGLGTYPQQHAPIAIYSRQVNRTYFVFGASSAAASTPSLDETICAISYFDHTTRQLARPRELLRRDVLDAHENPVLCLDPQGHPIVFCPAHGSQRPSTILRSRRPHEIDSFDVVAELPGNDNFSYPQPWWMDGQGLVFLHTFYEPGNQRRLAVAGSGDGRDWSAWDQRRIIVRMARGSYQISWPDGRGGLGTAFDVHPPVEGDAPLNHRTNLYYMHTRDGGQTWQDAAGRTLELPLRDTHNPALVYDAAREGKLVYLKDLQYDAQGRPILIYLTATSAMPGPDGGPHEWRLLKFTDEGWQHHPITTSTHCYDHGSLVLLDSNDWRLMAPTAPGIDRYAAGGQMQLWQSTDQGNTWRMIKTLTADPSRNHTYARRPLHAHRDFVSLWADGRGYEPSESSLYFADADGRVFRMPTTMDADVALPEPLA